MKQYAKQRKATEKNPNSKDYIFEIEISWTGETIGGMGTPKSTAGNRWVKQQFVFPYFHDVSFYEKHQASRGTVKSEFGCSSYPHHFQNQNYLVSLLFTVLPLPKKLQEATWSSMNEFRYPLNNPKLLTFRKSQSLKLINFIQDLNQHIPFCKTKQPSPRHP